MKKLITLLLITSSMLVQAQNNINLPQGWSMFGYNCAIPLDAGLAFNPISDKIVIVKDHLGNAYLPEANFNGIGNLMESRGYQIKMTETVEGFEFCEAVVPEDGVTQGDVDAVQALLDSVVPEDGITQSDVDLVQALLDSVVPEDGVTQSDVDAVQALLDAIVPEDGVTQGDVDAAYLDGVGSVVPEDGVTQADVDSAVSAVQEEYIGWCLSDIDNDGICDVDEVAGCMAATACNYTPEAEFSDASCTYADASLDCDGNVLTYEIGDLVEGGMVFYIDETGEHGLVAALEDLPLGNNICMGEWGVPGGLEWGCYEETVSGADGTAIGTGYQNTLDVLYEFCEAESWFGGSAAMVSSGYESEGYTDWFLPSVDELQEMYNTIGNGGSEGNIGGFDTDGTPYWSSTEYSNYKAWSVNFNNGSTADISKSYLNRVRYVRAF
jgi:hypothetical protein